MIPDDLKDRKGFWTSVYVNSIVLGYNKNLVKEKIFREPMTIFCIRDGKDAKSRLTIATQPFSKG